MFTRTFFIRIYKNGGEVITLRKTLTKFLNFLELKFKIKNHTILLAKG